MISFGNPADARKARKSSGNSIGEWSDLLRGEMIKKCYISSPEADPKEEEEDSAADRSFLFYVTAACYCKDSCSWSDGRLYAGLELTEDLC